MILASIRKITTFAQPGGRINVPNPPINLAGVPSSLTGWYVYIAQVLPTSLFLRSRDHFTSSIRSIQTSLSYELLLLNPSLDSRLTAVLIPLRKFRSSLEPTEERGGTLCIQLETSGTGTGQRLDNPAVHPLRDVFPCHILNIILDSIHMSTDVIIKEKFYHQARITPATSPP